MSVAENRQTTWGKESLVQVEGEIVPTWFVVVCRGVTSQAVEGFDVNSGVLEEQLHGQDASTVFFVEGRALVRITLSGGGRAEFIWEIARLAREKSDS